MSEAVGGMGELIGVDGYEVLDEVDKRRRLAEIDGVFVWKRESRQSPN